MRKILALLLAAALLLACTAVLAEEETCVYTVYNVTGEKVTELYVTDNATGEKSVNYAGEEGLADGASVEISGVNKEGYELTLSFKTEGGYEGSFPTLHFETVPISLLAADALSGATQINFNVPDVTCTYTVFNVTGEKVTELYLKDTITGEAGENYVAEAGLDNGASIELTKTVKADATGRDKFVLDLAFKTESGYEGSFPTLHFETVPISLLAADALSGATQISFTAPDVTCTYTVYNVTGEKVTALYLIDTITGDISENYAGEEGLADGASIDLSKTVKADATGRDKFVLNLVFKTEGGYEGSFPTLHFETVPISLIKVDAASGATTIQFAAPEGK